jgi:hypothetical protein
MTMAGRNKRTLALFTVLVVMLACAPGLAPAVPPTLDPSTINTVVAQTVAAAGTQTAILNPPTVTPSATPPPTKTPTEIPSPTVTFIFILPTSTVPSPTSEPSLSEQEFDCNIVSQSPANNTPFGAGAVFEARWRVENIGTSNWNGDSTDYRYTGGDKIHTQSIYDLPRSVPSTGQIDIVVDMKAPNNAGTYSTTWKLRIGKTEFCPMKLTIIVY